MADTLRVVVSGARSSAVSAEHGITPGELRELQPAIDTAHRALRKERADKALGFYDAYRDKSSLREVSEAARAFGGARYENLVVLGIGGSALGLTTLVTALKPRFYNLLSSEERDGRPRVFVMDNVDPTTFDEMLNICRPERTLFNVISKSGGTAETLSQLMIVLDILETSVGKSRVKDHVLVTTGPGDSTKDASPLDVAVRSYGLRTLTVPPNIGGRFSVFSPVGLFPAAVLGMDIDALMAGCKSMDMTTSGSNIKTNPAYLRAALHFLALEEKGKSISVMMPYSDALRDVSDWYRQLWAESLGKRSNLNGTRNDVHTGQTPVKALGVTDQHSQLQLYLEGPNDKLITVIEETKHRRSLNIPKSLSKAKGLAYLRGATMNELLAAECRATVDALREAQRPLIRVVLSRVNEKTVAQLLYMLQVETAMMGRLLDINAFDQPAVERIKVLTRAYMGKSK